MVTQNNFLIESADSNDIPFLIDHHRRMFLDIMLLKGKDTSDLNTNDIDSAYKKKLKNELGRECRAWVIRDKGFVLASGAISIISLVPVPYDPSSKVAYLHSIFTEDKFRKNGFARMIVEKAIQYCKSKGIKRIILNASNSGIPLYESLGFEPAENSMRLWI